MNDETIITEISRLTLKPGDVLVVRVPEQVSAEGRQRVRETVRRVLNVSGHRDSEVLIMSSDITLEILEHAA